MSEAVAEVVRVVRAGDVTTTEIRLLEGSRLADPVAPAGLYGGPDAAMEVLQLHRLAEETSEGWLVFVSYDVDTPLPEEGTTLTFRPWWTPAAFAAATDRTLRWARRRYNEDDHGHCLLTWQTLASGDEAYRSSAGDWVSVDAYQRYIESDTLHLRRED